MERRRRLRTNAAQNLFRSGAGRSAGCVVPAARARAGRSDGRASATRAGPCCRSRRTLRRLSGARRRVERSVGWRAQADRTGTDPRTRPRRGQRLDTHTQRESTVAVCGLPLLRSSLLIAGTVLVWQSRRAGVLLRQPRRSRPRFPDPPRPRSFSCKSLRFGRPPPGDLSVARVGETRTVRRSRVERSTPCEGMISRRPSACCRRWCVVNREARRRSSIWA